MKKIVASVAFALCLVLGASIVSGQDTTTLLSYFLTDLRAGAIGTRLSTSFVAKDGLVGSPGISFASETTSGLYRAGTNNIALSVNSTATVSFGAGTMSLPAGGGSFQLAGVKMIILTVPTISSGFGTSPSILTSTTGGNYTATFRVNVGTGGAATSGVVGLPTASNGWNCLVQDMTTNVATRQTANNATTVTVTAASAWTASDILMYQCIGY